MLKVSQEESRVSAGDILDNNHTTLMSLNPSSNMTPQRPKRDLWEEALQRFEESDQKTASILRADVEKRLSDADIVSSVLQQAYNVYEEYRKKHSAFRDGNTRKRHIFLDKIYKMINSIMQFKGLVDAGLKFGPSGYGTIAWTATSFCFQVQPSDIQVLIKLTY